MPSKIVDLSARSAIIREEPFYLHFWECTPQEYLDFLREPAKDAVWNRYRPPRRIAGSKR